MIKSFKSEVLQDLWMTGDTSLLSGLYVFQVVDILDLLDDVFQIEDLEQLGGFQVIEYLPGHWSVTVTVNNIESIGSVTCRYHKGNAYDVELREYD